VSVGSGSSDGAAAVSEGVEGVLVGDGGSVQWAGVGGVVEVGQAGW